LTTLLAFAFVLGVLVFVHELGHFLAAKRVGIRVLKFQLGFNPTVLSVRRGETEYSIGALPLGGYVKMAGESVEDERSGKPDEFLSKSRWERFQVLIMGPTMNILLALVLTAVVLYQGAEIPSFQDQPPVVGVVVPGSPASKIDIRPGDRVVSVADRAVDTWEQFFIAIGSRPNREVSLRLLRDGLETTRTVTPVPPGESRFEIGDIGVLPDVHPHIREDDSPRRSDPNHLRDAGQARRTGPARHRHRRRNEKHQAGRGRSHQLEREEEHRVLRPDFRNGVGTPDAADLASAVDGSGGDRTALG
jgi:membrane-associated protease RseP (regulator of RpoE activity)